MFELWKAVTHRCSVKKVFLEISQNSQENNCARVSILVKLQPWGCEFPVNFAQFLITPFLKEYIRWLLLNFPTLKCSWFALIFSLTLASLFLQNFFLYKKSVGKNLKLEGGVTGGEIKDPTIFLKTLPKFTYKDLKLFEY